jgi:glycosyltransferase involved in cell wall biosynthesis
MTKADVLFVHNNFPGQFGFIAKALKQRGMRCAAIGSDTSKSVEIPVRHWALPRGTGKDTYNLAIRAEADLIRGRAAAEVALTLRDQGFSPNLIIGHPGWGETSLLAEVFPKARQILHGEYYYASEGGDVGFDPEFGAITQEERFRVFAKNATMALAYLEADQIVSPTAFQASFFPPALRSRINLIHEGIDTDAIRARENVKVKIGNGPELDSSTPVITFINRNFEPLRGFHIFMRALPELLKAVPNAHVIMIGAEDGRGYGAPNAGMSWKAKYLSELGDKLDMSRLHFPGKVPHNWMLDALSISSAHVYYTYPFVLSWSLLEAMACECLVLGSDTGPLRDAIEDGVNGRLLNFFDVKALSKAMIEACRHPEKFQKLRTAARRTVVEKFDRATICQPAWMRLIDDVLSLGPRER